MNLLLKFANPKKLYSQQRDPGARPTGYEPSATTRSSLES